MFSTVGSTMVLLSLFSFANFTQGILSCRLPKILISRVKFLTLSLFWERQHSETEEKFCNRYHLLCITHRYPARSKKKEERLSDCNSYEGTKTVFPFYWEVNRTSLQIRCSSCKYHVGSLYFVQYDTVAG